MHRVLITLLFCLSCSQANAVELLVKANPHWMDSFKQTDINKMSVDERRSFDARATLGDIIVIRPDGWVWGREECLPKFIVVKVPGVTVEAAKKYEEQLMLQDGTLTNEDGSPKMYMAKVRKYKVPQTYINQVVNAGTSVVTINLSAEKTAFINSIVEKTQ